MTSSTIPTRRPRIATPSSLDPAVIIEFGSAIIRCGYVGEAAPRHSIPSPISVLLDGQSVNIYAVRQCSSLNDTNKIMRNKLMLASNGCASRQFTQQEYEVVLEPLLERILVDLLLCHKIRSRRVIIIEHIFNIKPLREAITKVLFESLGIASVMFLVDIVCPTFALHPPAPSLDGHQLLTNIVLDIGSIEARSGLVCDGNPLIDTFQCASVGHESLVKEFRSKLEDDFRLSLSFSDASFVFDFITEHVLVNLTFTKALSSKSDHSDDNFHLICIPSTGKHERIPIKTILSIWDNAIQEISFLLLKTTLSSPIDLRRKGASNIVMVGGGSMVSGLCDRIQDLDLLQHFGSKVPASVRTYLSNLKFTFSKQLFPGNISNWVGASIYGTTNFNDGVWLSQETWRQHREKSLLDWLNISKLEKKEY